ncbi:MAG: glutamyl-tRNA reductase [Anaerolineae bacterium]
MTILCIGFSYHNTPVEIRESLSFRSGSSETGTLEATLSHFCRWRDSADFQELVILSTCNRVEIYAATASESTTTPGDQQVAALAQMVADARGVSPTRFAGYLYHFWDLEAAHHLFRVVAGLDSMVLGEPQILGQVADAFAASRSMGSCGLVLSALFQTAVRVGKRARSETSIARHPASISSMAVWKAQQIVGDLTQVRALVVGVGKMGQLALKALGHRRTGQISLVNRTYERAAVLAKRYGVEAHPFTSLASEMARADIVISATGADGHIINAAMVRQAMARRPTRPLVLVDIAVPRDIAPGARDVPGAHLFDVDGLQGQVDDAVAERRKAIPDVEHIIQAEMAQFARQLRQLSVRPIIVDMRQKAEAIRQQELARTRRFVPDLDPAVWQHIEHLSHSLMNKLLHEPTRRLRDEAGNGRAIEFAETARFLFGLETGDEDGNGDRTLQF